MHGEGTDLDFQHLAFRAHHRRVQALVAVGLGAGDIVVEFLGHVLPQGMDDAQGGVAVAQLRHQYPHGAHVIDFAEFQVLFLHLPPDAVDMLGPAVDFGAVDAVFLQVATQLLQHIVDVLFPVQAFFIQQLGDLLVGARLQIAEGQVLQLPLELPDPEAMGQGRIDIEDFLGHLALTLGLGFLHGADNHGPLGQLHQGHAHVVDHGHQHFAHVVELAVLLAEHRLAGGVQVGANGGHAQHAFDQAGHIRAEFFLHFRQGDLPFAHGAVENGCGQHIGIGAQVNQHFGHFQADIQAALAIGPVATGGFPGHLALFRPLTGLLQCLAVAYRGPGIKLRQPVTPVTGSAFCGTTYRYHVLSFWFRWRAKAEATLVGA